MTYQPPGYFPDGYQPTGYFPDGYQPTPSSAPILAVTLSGLVASATITSGDEATNYLLYKSTADTEWQDGGSRVGSGNLVVSGLLANSQYTFMVYSEENGNRSVPSVPVTVQTERGFAAESSEFQTDGLVFMIISSGEEITYYPPAGGSRQILALVDRLGAQDIPGVPEGSTEVFRIVVLNSPTEGISSAEVNVRKSKIGLSRRSGLAKQVRVVWSIENQDESALQLLAG